MAANLVQVFNKQITLFREAVYILFGYRVEMATDPAARWVHNVYVCKYGSRCHCVCKGVCLCVCIWCMCANVGVHYDANMC